MDDISKYPVQGIFKPDEYPKSTVLLGGSFSGKTTLLVDELNKLSPDDYTLIVLFTESKNAQPFKKLKTRVKIIEGFDPDIIRFLKNINDRTNNRYNFLCLLDDVIDQKYAKELSKMILTYRNSGISSCISIQYPMLINKSSRSSFHQVLLLGAKSTEWWKSASDIFDLRGWWKDLHPFKISNDDIYRNLKEITKPHNTFIYINQREGKEPNIINS